jgi:HD-like signal output (HDOD) protein
MTRPTGSHVLAAFQTQPHPADSEGVEVTGPVAPVSAEDDPQGGSQSDRIARCLVRIEQSDGFPALSQQIHALMCILDNEDASVQQLANIVLKDYSLTLKVIRAANSFQYNRSGRPILSATHAMVLLGVQSVRNLVSGLVLFEHYQHRSPGLKQLMLLSLLTANHARSVANRSGTAANDEAYLCGMFRNLGEVLVASHLPDRYAAILRRMREASCGEQQAASQILGFGYEALGEALAAKWNMPPLVQQSFRVPDPPKHPVDRIVSFGHALTTVVYRRDPQTACAGLTALLQKFGPMLGLEPDDVRDILDVAISETRSTFDSMKLKIDDLRLRRQMDAALGVPATSERDPSQPADDCVHGQQLTARLAEEVEAQVRLPSAGDLNRILLMALEVVLRSGRFDRVVFALLDSTRTEVTGRLGLGDNADALVNAYRVRVGVRGGPIGMALAREQELLLSRAWEMRPDESALLERLNAAAVVMLPVIVGGTLVGGLHAELRSAATLPDSRTLTLVRRMRDAIARALSARRAA